MALLKGEKFDLVVRQATEAGVAGIIPLACERSLGATPGPARRERLERLIREALQQSGSPVPTRLEEACSLPELGARLGPQGPSELRLLLHEEPLVDSSLHGYLGRAPERLVLCVGPEGGFSPGETAYLTERAGFRPLRLPGAILRAETAAIFALAAAQTILGERDSWKPERD
jgi:16S rRNA (uracil1498-N3)-methyltransferase